MFRLLRQRSFRALFLTHALGTTNDNALRQLVLLLSTGAGIAWVSANPRMVELGPAIGQALFALPFLLVAGVAGSLSDRVSKTSLLRYSKVGEVAVVSLTALGLWQESLALIFLSLFLMGLQSAVFGPVRFGTLGELLEPKDLSRGYGLMQMGSFISILLGVLMAGGLVDAYAASGRSPAPVLLGLAALGLLTAFRVRPLPAANPERRLELRPHRVFMHSVRVVRGDKPLWSAILGGGGFWMFASASLLAITSYGAWIELSGTEISLRIAALAIGIALGALVAGKLSGDRVEAGWIPIGVVGMATALVFATSGALEPAAAALPKALDRLTLGLGLAGFSGGFVSVPVRATIQARVRPEERGTTLGLCEVADFGGVLLAAGLHALLASGFGLNPAEELRAIAVLLALAGALSLGQTAKPAVRLLILPPVRILYRMRSHGGHHVPPSGGALMVSNHVSFLDAFLISAASPRSVRFLMYRPFFSIPVIGTFCRWFGTLPISSKDTAEQKRATLSAAAEIIRKGGVVGIFAEGSITRNGEVDSFARGLENIARRSDATIVPLAIEGMWGSFFSHGGGPAMRTMPWPRFPRVQVGFAAPLAPETERDVVRSKVTEELARLRSLPRTSLLERMGRALSGVGDGEGTAAG